MPNRKSATLERVMKPLVPGDKLIIADGVEPGNPQDREARPRGWGSAPRRPIRRLDTICCKRRRGVEGRYLEFFAASLGNNNTLRACLLAVQDFCAFLKARGVGTLALDFL